MCSLWVLVYPATPLTRHTALFGTCLLVVLVMVLARVEALQALGVDDDSSWWFHVFSLYLPALVSSVYIPSVYVGDNMRPRAPCIVLGAGRLIRPTLETVGLCYHGCMHLDTAYDGYCAEAWTCGHPRVTSSIS